MWLADDEAGVGENAKLAAGGKTFERITQCIMAAMDRSPVEFAAYLPYFLPLYSSNALLAMDTATVHRIRPKRRILLMRFLARALLCPVYQLDWFEMQMAGMPQQPRVAMSEHVDWSTARSRRQILPQAHSNCRMLIKEEACVLYGWCRVPIGNASMPS